MKIRDIIRIIEKIAPVCYQENYDNSGLQIGSPENEVTSVLICLDINEAVVDEAISAGANFIISHHPLIFSGIKNITGKSYIERIIIKAITNNISIYSSHTSLDNSALGVNKIIADKLGLKDAEILDPKSSLLYKVVVFVPVDHLENVREAMFLAGAGEIGNYDNCSFSTSGDGTFKANEKANPFVGQRELLHSEKESRLEMIVPLSSKENVIKNMLQAHPYEEVAYDIFKLENKYNDVGSGMIGNLENEMPAKDFALYLKEHFDIDTVKCAFPEDKKIKRVALCGGSGSFLINKAISAGADCFITGEIKYHDYLDFYERIALYEIGHYDSEKFTMELLKNLLNDKVPELTTQITNIKTNPIKYF